MHKLPCILLVDDDSTTNYLNRKLLTRLDIAEHITVTMNGKEALEQLTGYLQQPATETPILVLLDVKMPVMDGFEFLAAFAQLPADMQRRVVIVVLTTSLHPHDVQRLEQLPIAGLLSKPLTREKVREVLVMHFGRKLA